METIIYIVYAIVLIAVTVGIQVAIENFRLAKKDKKHKEQNIKEFIEPEPKKIIIKDKDKIVGKAIINSYGIYLFDTNNERVNGLYSFLETLSDINEILKGKEIDIKDSYFVRHEFKRHYKEKHQSNMTKLRYGIKG